MKYWNQIDFTRFSESRSRRERHHYSPYVASFDTETSTISHEDKKIAFMYVWQMAIENVAFYGRTFTEFRHCLEKIKTEMHLSSEYKLVVYVHKLKYDFAFYKKEVNLEGDFIARSKRTIIKHIMQDCFEVRDSGCYTEEPLEEMGEEIGISKGKGYDYTKVRTFDTKLTDSELSYCENDVLILTKYFRHEAETYGNISRIPLTATQRVKRVIMQEFSKESRMYQAMIMSRQLKDTDSDNAILKLLKHAFFGAFNYSNTELSGINVTDVTGVDLDTCYGAQCLLHHYPMTKFKSLTLPASIEDLKTNPIYRGKAMLITFSARDVQAKYKDIGFLPMHIKNYWERSAADIKNVKSKRMLTAKKIRMTLTDVDFMLFLKLYTPNGGIKFESIQAADYGSLPNYMINSIVKMHTKKVETKARNKEIEKQRHLTLAEQLEYNRDKTGVSRIYGILVQDPIRPVYEWNKSEQEVKKVGDSTTRVQFQPVLYQWGVWVVAWARYEIIKFLFSTAYKDGVMQTDKVLYSDTDSLYFKSSYADETAIEAYNSSIDRKIRKFCEIYNKDYNILKDIGKLKTEHYEVFKTTGLKQYAYIQHGEFDYRCSGLPRPDYEYTADGQIRMNDNGSPINHGMTFFDNFETNEEKLAAFNAELSIPASEAHVKKNIYDDDGLKTPIMITDYLGGSVQVKPLSWVIIEETGFDFDKDPFQALENVDEDRFDFITEKFM